MSLALNSLPLSAYCQSWLLCPLKCACPVRYPVLVLSLFCQQEKEGECQPASIQLLLSYWYSGHTEPVWVSVARAKEERGKWGGWREEEERSEPPPQNTYTHTPPPPILCYVDLRIDRILLSFLFRVHLCFHTQRPSLDPPPVLSAQTCPPPSCFSVWSK